MNIQIITLTPTRWQENRELRLQALKENPEAFARTYEEDAALPEAQWQQWLLDAQEGKRSLLLFAENENKKLVGMVGAILGQGLKLEHTAKVVAMYVDPTHRGLGIGRQLMEALLNKLATNTHIVQVSLTVNTQAQAAFNLYESLGFKKVGIIERALKHAGKFYDEWLMVKIIGK